MKTMPWWSGLVAASVLAATAGARQEERYTLDNGATVILLPVSGAKSVGIEAVYRFGFIDEPAGLTQSAHLIEHLVCYAATESLAPKEAFDRLQQLGMANAETMPTLTHYDYCVPSAELDYALRVEGERLRSLRIEPELVGQEASRCYAEAAHVEGASQAPLMKFAVMAAHQGWRHGRVSAEIKGGLAEAPIESLRSLHAAAYVPENLTLVIVGGFDAAMARASVEARIGSVPRRDAMAREPIDWEKLPGRLGMKWDSTRAGVVLTAGAPAGSRDRAVLTVWGAMLLERLYSDREVAGVASFAACSGLAAPAGEAPFLVYATVKEGVTTAECERALRNRASALCEELRSPSALATLRLYAQQLTASPPLDARSIGAQAGQVARQMGIEEARGEMMILGNTALQIGMRDKVFGGDAGLGAITLEDVRRITAGMTRPEAWKATVLEPKN
jgi:hypothetical protein